MDGGTFFPTLLFFKTPLPFLILAAIGFVSLLIYVRKNPKGIHLLQPAVAAIVILAISMCSSINIGIRHILPIYPLLAIIAAYGALKLWQFRQSRTIGPILLTLLLIWQITSSFTVHPDYLAYFNVLAGNHPDKNFNDSDLDWGQDLKRLTTTVKKHKIPELAICYNGSADLERFDLPPKEELIPYQKTTGWIAVSVVCVHTGTGQSPYDQYSWLEAYQPVEMVGKSIKLYYIPKL